MFVQVIEGHVSEPSKVRGALDRWATDIATSAPGWLGTTAGVTADGTFIAMARFDSPEAAASNSARPEQDQWWRETSTLFTDKVQFHDCTKVDTFLAGGSDDAGFVQIIEGRATDPDRLRELAVQSEQAMHEARPEIIGGTIAMHGDGSFTEEVYFTSEPAAREGERKELTGDAKASFDEELALMKDVHYYDLNDPWMYSPR